MANDDDYGSLIKSTLGLIAITCFASVMAGRFNWALGFALGGVFSIINFLLLKRGLARRLGKSVRRVRAEGYFSLLYRFIFLAFPMVVAYKVERIDLTATIIGIFAMQISILLYYLILKKFTQ